MYLKISTCTQYVESLDFTEKINKQIYASKNISNVEIH